jgi:hypothetical protein
MTPRHATALLATTLSCAPLFVAASIVLQCVSRLNIVPRKSAGIHSIANQNLFSENLMVRTLALTPHLAHEDESTKV